MPKIDTASLPGLESAVGLFGSADLGGQASPDVIVEIMVFLYETTPPAAFF
ncbi:MAG: hypothetical protein AAF941_09610 [Pseudomonadota bacterium]